MRSGSSRQCAPLDACLRSLYVLNRTGYTRGSSCRGVGRIEGIPCGSLGNPFLVPTTGLDDGFATIFCAVEFGSRPRGTALDEHSKLWDMTVLRRVDASRNMARFYALGVERTLFGEFALVREWGRIGCLGRRRSVIYPTLADAEAALAKLRHIKERRGYRCNRGPGDLLPSSEEP